MAEYVDTYQVIYEAGATADTAFRRERRYNRAEAQGNHLNPSRSAIVGYRGSSPIDLTGDSDDDLGETVAPQLLRQSREAAPLIDLTASPDCPTEPPHRDHTTSRRARIPRPPQSSTSRIISSNSNNDNGLFTDPSNRRSATRRAASRNISTVANQPSATRRAHPAWFLEFLTSEAFHSLTWQSDRKLWTPSPPPTRVGFTRDTCANPQEGFENVAICPACCNELAYSPYDTVLRSAGNASGQKRKREPEKRPFWALKNCGHVYCADCYNERKGIQKRRNVSDSRASDERFADNLAAEFSCAVEGCGVTGSNPDDWVGIYI